MRLLVARLVTPLVWRWPGHAARKLMGFARAEAGSRIDLQQAALATPSLSRRAAYLRHALDEARHATVFAQRAGELSGRNHRVEADVEDLFDRLGEIDFLAFVHRGEKRGRQQFEIYREYFLGRGDERTASVFTAILADERRHESYTLTLLRELAGEAGAKKALARMARWSAWRAWRRAGRALTTPIYTLAMAVVYLTVVPLVALLVKARR